MVGVLEDPSTGLAVEYPMGLSVRDALALVENEANHVRLHEQMLLGSVASARDAGASWELIGQVLGVTRQAAAQRFGPLLPE